MPSGKGKGKGKLDIPSRFLQRGTVFKGVKLEQDQSEWTIFIRVLDHYDKGGEEMRLAVYEFLKLERSEAKFSLGHVKECRAKYIYHRSGVNLFLPHAGNFVKDGCKVTPSDLMDVNSIYLEVIDVRYILFLRDSEPVWVSNIKTHAACLDKVTGDLFLLYHRDTNPVMEFAMKAIEDPEEKLLIEDKIPEEWKKGGTLLYRGVWQE